jgi:hypothetical protein
MFTMNIHVKLYKGYFGSSSSLVIIKLEHSFRIRATAMFSSYIKAFSTTKSAIFEIFHAKVSAPYMNWRQLSFKSQLTTGKLLCTV